MGGLEEETSGPVHGFRLSTVSASRPTETGTVHELTGLDLAMKLHYLKVVYIYSAETARDLTVMDVKGPLFPVFDQVPWITGRFRRHDDTGRPYIKCNDCGVRFVESQCDLTVDEWLRVPDRSVDESLVYHEPVGPDLAFSPLIYFQMTRFKCGGLAFGISWAHIMGDPLSISHLFYLWTRALVGENIHSPETSNPQRGFQNPIPKDKDPVSIKRVDPVGDLWVAPSNSKMTTFSFKVKVNDIKSHSPANGDEFEILVGIIWKCIATARRDSPPENITIIRNSDPNGLKPRSVRNGQTISSVSIDFSAAEASLEEIVKSIGGAVDERSEIDEVDCVTDLVVYGANLTFVDLSQVDFYEARVMNTSPESVYCNVQGIGEEGAVVVLPAAEKEVRVVTLTVTEEEMETVKSEMKNCGLINHGVN